jgi:hypothetical protein
MTPRPAVDKTAVWLNRAVTGGFIAVALYLTAHFAYALVDNAVRYTHLTAQQSQWQKLRTAEAQERLTLTQALHQAQSPKGLEALVRNKLQWVEEQEVLVRLH